MSQTDAAPAARKKTHRRKSNLGFPRAVFSRLAREYAQDFKSDLLWDPKAIQALQEASEHMLEQRFVRAARVAGLCKVDTVTIKHFREQTDTGGRAHGRHTFEG